MTRSGKGLHRRSGTAVVPIANPLNEMMSDLPRDLNGATETTTMRQGPFDLLLGDMTPATGNGITGTSTTTTTAPADGWVPRTLDHDRAFVNSIRMLAVKKMIDRVAPTDATVLVWGESGVGKEMVARALHQKSPRRDRPFIKVNSAALPLELLESELFGYERGAFTGAHRQKPGKFELANMGTIFLDEIGEMPPPLQAKLLQVLQDREFARLGSRQDIRVDVRVITATNKDLGKLVESGSFRQDLYYRLNVVNIHVPPLRERREEIPILMDHFLERYAQQYERPVQKISAATMRLFMNYNWPGNIRELENVMKRIVLLGTEEPVQDLVVRPAPVAEPPVALRRTPATAPATPDSPPTLKQIARKAALEAERAALKEVLDLVHWNRLEAARRLKVSSKTLRRKIQECGLWD
jgi:two-component system, NtrC family, response regulator AtoC